MINLEGLVENRIKECLAVITAKHSEFPHKITTTFDLTVVCAGWAKCTNWKIRLNWSLLTKYTADMVKTTVPHELCHLLSWHYFKGRGHGSEWKRLMWELGLPGDRCHSYNLQEVMPGKFMQFACGCQTHNIGVRKGHNILVNPSKFWCRRCKGKLTLV